MPPRLWKMLWKGRRGRQRPVRRFATIQARGEEKAEMERKKLIKRLRRHGEQKVYAGK